MSVELKQYCPYCNGKIAYPSEMAGTSTHCPHCRQEVELLQDIRQECRSCGEKVVFSESMVGEQTKCPSCGRMMELRPVSKAFWRSDNANQSGSAQSQYFISMRGQTEGPLTEAEVCNLVEKGHVRADARIRMGQTGAWHVLGQMPQFTASLYKQHMPETRMEEKFIDNGPPEITLMLYGQHYGPYTIGQVRHALNTGSADGFTEAHRPGMPGWKQLKQWDEFKNLDVIKALGNGTFDWRNQGFPFAMESFLTGVFLFGVTLVSTMFQMGPVAETVTFWITALSWLMIRKMVYPQIGREDESGSIFNSKLQDQTIMMAILYWNVFMFFRACTMTREARVTAIQAGQDALVSFTAILNVFTPILYLMFRGMNAGIRFFFKQKKTVVGWIINIFGLLFHLAFLVLFIIAVVERLNMARQAT